MKKFMLIVLVIILSKLSFVYADKPRKGGNASGASTFRPAPTESISLNCLKGLAGKTIYRDVPAQNETEFSKEYMNEPYELFSYNESIMELKNSDKKSIILEKDLWDDGNWKEWKKDIRCDSVSYFFHKINDNCSYVYNSKYNLRKGDHVVWDKKCGRILVFDLNNATVTYCRDISSSYYCTARDETEFIGANNLIKTYKCFKDSSNESEKYSTKTINKWYVGQEVWDVLKGRGVVVCTSVVGNDGPININVRFDTKFFMDWYDIDTYTLSGKYKENQAQRLFPTETKSAIFYLDKLFPKKIKN